MQKLHFSRSQVAKLFAAPPSTARLTLIQQERRLPYSPNGDNSKLRKKDFFNLCRQFLVYVAERRGADIFAERIASLEILRASAGSRVATLENFG